MFALIDGDEFLYRTCYACTIRYYSILADGREIARIEAKKEADAHCEGSAEDLEIVLRKEPKSFETHNEHFHAQLAKLMESLSEKVNDSCEPKVYFSDEYNFRMDIATILPYKGNRDGIEKPMHYHEMVDDLIWRGHAFRWRGAEADDALSYNQGDGSIIVSQDKDLDMVPGARWKNGALVEITEQQARASFYRQLLTGDPSDNIPGIFGLGKICSEKLISDDMDEREQIDVCLSEYREAMRDHRNKFFGMRMTDREVVLEIGRLLWLQRPGKILWRIPQ